MSEGKYKIIMLVDDNEVETFVTVKIIQDYNFTEDILTFLNTSSAMEYLKSNENSDDKLPSVIFLDIIMPVIDGFGFLEEFDKLNDTIHKNCKVVLLSTSDSFQDLNRANKNKYVAKFLTKPLLKEALDALNF